MSKARTLANLISDNAELADGQISVAEVVGAAPTASPTFTGNIDAGDNVKIRLGDSDDLQIYHDGSHSYIKDAGTGNLNLQGENLALENTSGDNYLVGVNGSFVKLYYSGAEKLATTATGIDVTGTAVTDGLTVAGNVSVDGGTIKLDGNYPVGTSNVALGDAAMSAVQAGADSNTAVGRLALTANTTADYNTAVGGNSLRANTTGHTNSSFGQDAMRFNSTGASNVAVGQQALHNNTTASQNTAVGYQASLNATTGAANTFVGGLSAGLGVVTGSHNVGLGAETLYRLTSGGSNVSIGYQALQFNTTGSSNVAIGREALENNTASNNTAVGHNALQANTTGSYSTAVGYQSGLNSTANFNTSVGASSLKATTTGLSNTAIGTSSMFYNTTGSYNTAIGEEALLRNTTASNNTAVGYNSGDANTSGYENVFIGTAAGTANTTGIRNLYVGNNAAELATTGSNNTYVGANGTAGSCGGAMTTGSKNTIIGGYTGNQGGLDIRTASNNIVLSDGDGNPRLNIESTGVTRINHTGNIVTALNPSTLQVKSSSGQNGIKAEIQNQSYVCYGGKSTYAGDYFFAHMSNHSNTTIGSISCTTTSTAYNTSSDHRLKENVSYTWDATTRLKQLKPARFNFISDADTTVDGFLAHEAQAVVPEAVTGTHNEVDEDGNPEYQGIDQSKLVPLLVKTIQELEARITALEGA